MTNLFRYRKPGYFATHYTPLYCRLMNVLDARLWGCPCEYYAPYGRVTSGDCRRHD